MIEIIPNWHPIFVHFTISLFSVAVGFYVLAYLAPYLPTKLKSLKLEFEIVARWCLWIGALATIITLLTGLYAFNTAEPVHKSPATTSSSTDIKKPLYWVDPMEPTVHYEKSGKSRMGMELVPIYGEEHKQVPGEAEGIKISPDIINNLGVRTAVIKETEFQQRVTAYGIISPIEDNIMSVSSHMDGWVKKLYAKEIGEFFKKDQLLLEFYSPTAVQAQQQYLVLMKQRDRPEDVLFLRKKLKTLGISEQQMDDIVSKKEIQENINIYAPENGVITELNVREGAQVKPEETLLRITDLSTVWAMLEVFGEDALSLKKGEKVDIRIPDVSDKVWQAAIDYVYPEANPTLRTTKVRVSLPNPDNLFKINMAINATILLPSKKAITIPREALIYSTSKNYVIVSLGQGRFAPREVTPGLESENEVEILSGLKPGEKVVVSGQFLIDSESNLKAGFSRLSDSESSHSHKGH